MVRPHRREDLNRWRFPRTERVASFQPPLRPPLGNVDARGGPYTGRRGPAFRSAGTSWRAHTETCAQCLSRVAAACDRATNAHTMYMRARMYNPVTLPALTAARRSPPYLLGVRRREGVLPPVNRW